MASPTYQIEYQRSVAKDLRKLPVAGLKLVVARIQKLVNNPFPTGAQKLVGKINLWRVRQGDYRIIYQVIDSKLVVLIVKIGHRKAVYRQK